MIELAYATANAHLSSAAQQEQVTRMRPLGKLVALSIFVVGVMGVVEPDHLIAIAQYLLTPPGLHASPALPIATGVLLILLAPVSRAPRSVRIIGVLMLVAGAATPLLGVERPQVVADWAAAQGPWTLRGIGALLGAIGAIIGFATDPSPRPT